MSGADPKSVETPKVVAVVLDWNGADDTVRCVRSLRRIEYPDLEILVVDNGSRVSPAEALRAAQLEAGVLSTGINLGYAGGNNAGIDWAIARGADFVWILNNDAEVDPAALSPLVDAARRSPRAGVFGSRVVRGDDPSRIWVAWGEVTWRQSLIRLVGENAPDGPGFHGERDVEWLPGCSLLFRADALREVGGFDERYFAYHEDVDWAARARALGWTCRYVGSSLVVHHIHGSSGGASHYGGFRKYLSARNSILYARRHGTMLEKATLAASIIATFPFQLLRRSVSGEAAGVWIKQRGWRDALAGRPIPLVELGLRDKDPGSAKSR
ncbi:MAG TPA: glycosyltransferase family 2 protein [Candidatus Limnocylindrales bacterium]|nr:glycosyltransferase family 2 protein [Candidatus Limnocylindrales bacterium]